MFTIKKNTSSKEFLKNYNDIWKEGPAVRYRGIGSKEMVSQSINKNPNLW